MKCEELRECYELYAMGVAEEPEQSEIRDHLNRGCEVCMAEMKRARAISALLGVSVADAAPSPKLRRRILASVGYEHRSFGWAPAWAAVAALGVFGAIYFSARERGFAEEAARLRNQMRQQTIELTQLNEAFAIMSAPDTQEVSFGEDKPKPKGKVFVHPSYGVLLIASNLPPAPAGKLYEMWRIPKNGKPVGAGLFQSAGDGTAMHMQRGAVDPDATGAVAVTLENEGGADQPTSQPLIVAQLVRRGL
jgi:anti-sigma-K factor RskA